jgi:outer membrane protein OmpA-like peptidoglycan-associated protein
MSSNREGTKGSDDIWSIVLSSLLFTIEGELLDAKFKEPIPGVTMILKGSDGSVVKTTTDKDGKYAFIENEAGERLVNENVTYEVSTFIGPDVITPRFRNGFVNSSVKYSLTTVGETESKKYAGGALDIILTPITPEIKFPAVLYDLGKATLTENAKDSLSILFLTLLDNPTFVIELSAHTDSRGSHADNLILSEDRAKSCYDYLVSKGIPSDRMQPKGYGEERLKITDKTINSFATEEEREAAHQENRRTVFSVLSKDYPIPQPESTLGEDFGLEPEVNVEPTDQETSAKVKKEEKEAAKKSKKEKKSRKKKK